MQTIVVDSGLIRMIYGDRYKCFSVSLLEREPFQYYAEIIDSGYSAAHRRHIAYHLVSVVYLSPSPLPPLEYGQHRFDHLSHPLYSLW